MQKPKIIFLIPILIIATTMILYLKYEEGDQEAHRKNFQKQLGTYELDIHKTTLDNYNVDSDLYKNLRITFKADSTFSMNMKVPFMYDSIGKWVAAGGGLEDWNRLLYKSWNYTSYDKNTGNQFTQPWTEDSIFYINGATPQNGADFIQEIYFRKVNR